MFFCNGYGFDLFFSHRLTTFWYLHFLCLDYISGKNILYLQEINYSVMLIMFINISYEHTHSAYSCSSRSANVYPIDPHTSPAKNLTFRLLQTRLILFSCVMVQCVAHTTSNCAKYSSDLSLILAGSALTLTMGFKFCARANETSAL